MSDRRTRRGPEAFHRFYLDMLGERWHEIEKALRAEKAYETLQVGLGSPYYLDAASAVAARSLGACAGDRLLDLCAAPGGKTLVLAQAIQEGGTILANERSSGRRARLGRVLDAHLPAGLRAAVSIAGFDAATWGLHERNMYDRVLLDAPCSSEAHLMAKPAHLRTWSPSRTRNLAMQAHSMLVAAVDAVVLEGTVVYSTCAFSTEENDGVIRRYMKKRSELVAIEDRETVLARALAGSPRQSRDVLETAIEATEFGFQIWPDRAPGYGPIYFACLRKRRAS